MTKKELKQFVEMVEEQFNTNKELIIDGYAEYLKDCDDDNYKTSCIESFGVVMIAEGADADLQVPFEVLYNFINSFREFAKEKPTYAFEQKPEYCIEYYTDNFLQLAEMKGVKRLFNKLK